MRRFAWVLCGVVALLLGSHVSAGEALFAPKEADAKKADAKKADAKKAKKAKKATKKKSEAAREEVEISFEAMKRVVSPTAGQEEKLRALWDAREKALSEWDATAQGQRLATLKNEIALATGAERASLASQLRTLTQQREQIAQQHDGKIMALLTGEQRAKWWGYLLYGDVCRLIASKSVDLTGDQSERVQSMCNAAGKRMPAVPTASGKSRMVARLADEIFRHVLTDKQRKTVDPDYKVAGKKKSGSRDRNRRNRNNRNNRNNKLLSGKGKIAPLAKPGGM